MAARTKVSIKHRFTPEQEHDIIVAALEVLKSERCDRDTFCRHTADVHCSHFTATQVVDSFLYPTRVLVGAA